MNVIASLLKEVSFDILKTYMGKCPNDVGSLYIGYSLVHILNRRLTRK